MRIIRRFTKVDYHKNELKDLQAVLFKIDLDTKASYANMSVEEYDKIHRIKKDLGKLEDMIELGSSKGMKHILMVMSEESKGLVPDSVLKLIQ